MNFIGFPIIELEEIDSTNIYLAQQLKEKKINSGTIVIANQQTKGRGQREKAWISDAFSNLTVSIAADLNLWEIKNPVSLVHIVAISVKKLLENYLGNVKIKWPNDIMANDKKLVGILIENQISSTKRHSIIGIGINVNQKYFAIQRATSMYLESGKEFRPKDLLFELIEQINTTILLYQQKGEQHLFDLFNSQLWKQNQNHSFYIENEEKIGEIQATTMDGQLIIDFNGEKQVFINGAVKY